MNMQGIAPTEKGMTESREMLGVILKASLARKLWGEDAAFKVTTTHSDKEFSEAMNILLNPTRYNAILAN